MATRIDFDIKGIDGVLDLLNKLPAEVVSNKGGPVKLALRTGARVLQKQVIENLQRSLANKPQYTTGLLLKNIIVSRGKAPASGNGERALIRVRKKVYPGKSGRSGGGKAVTTLVAAQLLEYGSSHQPAEPFIRPAFNVKAREAVDVTTADLVKRIDRIVKKLAKTGGR